MDRRKFIVLAGGSLAGSSLALPGWVRARDWVKPERIGTNPFALGVASGDPTQTSICLWTRLAPEPLDGGGLPHTPAEVTWDLSTQADFSKNVQSGRVYAWPEFAHVAKPKVEGLQPGRTYFYRFRFGKHESRVGQFRTAPAAGDERPVRFGVVSCNRYEDGWFHAFRHLCQDEVDFVFHAGDYIYEKASKPNRMRQHLGEACYSLEDYRLRYAQYKLDPDLQDLHAATAFVATWDDHEVAGNWAGAHDKLGTPDEVFAMRRAAAFQAYWEAMPFDVPLPKPGGELKLYRSFQYGDKINFLVLDGRQYRGDQACGDTTTRLCKEALEPGRSMLGKAQEAWMERQITKARQKWNIIGQQVPPFTMDYDPGESQLVTMDKWDGYPEAQKAFNQLLSRAEAPSVTLSGDAHQHLAARRRHWENGEEQGADLVATSVTSGGDGQEKDDHWDTLRASNPDLLYNSRRRGYLLLEVGYENLDVEFRTLDSITIKAHKLLCSAKARVSPSGQLDVREVNQTLRQVKS